MKIPTVADLVKFGSEQVEAIAVTRQPEHLLFATTLYTVVF